VRIRLERNKICSHCWGIRPWWHLPTILRIASADTMVLHRDRRRRPRQGLEYSMAPVPKRKRGDPEGRKIPVLGDEIGRCFRDSLSFTAKVRF
jgi:hypothetical protein